MSGRGLAIDTAAWTGPWRARRVADKALLSFGLLACAVGLPAWPSGVAAGVAAAVVLLGPARVSPRLVLRAVSVPAVFVVVGALALVVGVSWDGGPRVAWAPGGVPEAGAAAVRGIAGTLAVFVLAMTTPMVDLFAALRRVGIPAVLIDVVGLVYRFVFVLLESLGTIRQAQEARLGYASRAAAYRSLSGLVTAVLVRSWERARRLEDGLTGRGYVDALPTLDPVRHGSVRFVVCSVTLVAAIVTLGWVAPAVGGWR